MLKRKMVLILGGIAMAATLGVYACSSQISGQSDPGFHIMNVQDSIVPDVSKLEGIKLLHSLNLTNEQKDQLKALREEGMANFKKNEDKRNQAKEMLKTAFLSDKTDTAALKTGLLDLRPDIDARTKQIGQKIIQVYNILTPDQRDKIEAFLNKAFSEEHFKKIKSDRMANLFKGLDLTVEQKEKIENLINSNASFREKGFEKIKQVKASVLSELKSGTASADKIALILKQLKPDVDSMIDKQLDNFAQIHDILTPAQREKLVLTLETKRAHFKKIIEQKPFLK